jgi:hypothetical protein
VTADSLYEAVAHGLRVFRQNDWVDTIGRGQTTISVVVKYPAVEHKVRVQDFEHGWSRKAELLQKSASKIDCESSLNSDVTSTPSVATGRGGEKAKVDERAPWTDIEPSSSKRLRPP